VAVPDDYRAESRKGWGEQAEGWGERAEQLRTATMPVSAWMIDALDPQPGDTLLELAAGPGDTGLLAAELVQPGGTLISSDFSPEMLSVAQSRAEQLGIGNARFKQIDADTSFDLETASIDGVLCRWGYMLMTDPENALRETRRVLRPGRRVSLAVWAGPDANPWSALPGQELLARGLVEPPEPGAPGQFAWADEATIVERLEAAGFVEHHIEPLDFPFVYRSASDWWATLLDCSKTLSGAVAQADDDTVAEIGDALDRHAEAFRATDGTLHVPARTWVACAAA
jgi:SAM-dependent methyltransferase